MSTRCSFGKKENKLCYYRGKDFIEKLCKKLKEHAKKIINYEEKELLPLLMKKISLIENNKYAIYAKKSFVWIKMMNIILMEKRLKIIAITQKNLEQLLIANAI